MTEEHNASAKAQREEFNNQCSMKVKALRDMLKGMSKEQKAEMKDEIKNQISAIRESFSSLKKVLQLNTLLPRKQHVKPTRKNILKNIRQHLQR